MAIRSPPPEPDPCLICGEKHAAIGIGPPLTKDAYRLCWNCFLLTPAGVAHTQNRIREQLGETDDGVRTGETVATDEPGGRRGS